MLPSASMPRSSLPLGLSHGPGAGYTGVVAAFLGAGLVLLASPALAVTEVVGDADGFGITSTGGLVRATGAPHTQPADVDGDGILEAGDFLPDWNADGITAIAVGHVECLMVR